jgi:hypothetical protein
VTVVDLDVLDDDDLFDTPGEVYDPFSAETALGIERDRWDRPLIKPDPALRRRVERYADRYADLREGLDASNGWPDGKVERWQMADGRRPYARISSLAGGIDPAFGLGIWYRRHVALSLARRADLRELLATMTYADGKAIDEVCKEALIRAKDDKTDPERTLTAAHRGTTFHRATDPALGIIYGPTLKDYEVAAKEMEEALAESDLEIIDTERFVVCDPLRAAGTYDHLVRDLRTGAVHVLDKKTGKLQWVSHIVQVEGYTLSKHYDARTGRRTPLHADMDPHLGFIAATDLTTGKCKIFEMDLDGSYVSAAVDVWEKNKADAVKAKVRARN